MINSELGDAALAPNVLDSVFEMWWPRLQSDVQSEMSRTTETEGGFRSERDILEEVLGLTRSFARDPRLRTGAVSPAAIDDLLIGYASLLRATRDSECDEVVTAAMQKLIMPLRHIAKHGRGLRASSEAITELIEAGIVTPLVSPPPSREPES